MPRKLERDYQPMLIKRIRVLLPGCVIQKLDTGYQQGIPDLLILWEDRWAILEVKKEQPRGPQDFEPNQEWFIEQFNAMSFSACVYPENEEEVLDALQRQFKSRRKARVPKR